MLILSVFGGVAADRLPKRTLIQIEQSLNLINAVVLAALIFLDVMRIEWLVVSSVVQGAVMSLALPARQTMIPEIVGTGRLMNAISLRTAGLNAMRLFSPAAGGLIVALAGFGWAFLAIGALYAVALVGLQRVVWRPAAAPGVKDGRRLDAARSGLREITQGMRYVKADVLIASLLGVSFISAVFAYPYQFLLPGYVADIFRGGGTEIGFLTSVSAIGSVGGSLVLASMPNRRRGLILLIGISTLSVGLFAFAQTDSYAIAAGLMIVVGIGAALYQALSQGLIISYVERAYLGRVMSIYFMQFSVMQLGTLVVGVLAESVGIRAAFAGMGVGLMLVALAAFLFVSRVRRLD